MNALKRTISSIWNTTDGKTFTSKKEAATHQADLDRLDTVKALLENNLPAPVTLTDAQITEITALIVVHADALREILPKRAKPEAPTPEADPAAVLAAAANAQAVAGAAVSEAGLVPAVA
jgi:dsDNA-binding SOS-regulon protein